MNVILQNDTQTVEYKTGSALYMLFTYIPIIGIFIFLAMTIIRKQFRGIILNQFVIGLIWVIFFFIFGLIGNPTLFLLVYLAALIFQIYMLVIYILNANKFSVKQRLQEGYRVVNVNEPQIQQFLQEVELAKKPFWQITRF